MRTTIIDLNMNVLPITLYVVYIYIVERLGIDEFGYLEMPLAM